MADVNVVEEKVTVLDGVSFRGRLPTVDSLKKKISRIERIIKRAENVSAMLPDLQRKLTVISDPRWKELREKAEKDAVAHRADRAESLLASLPADKIAAILAKLNLAK